MSQAALKSNFALFPTDFDKKFLPPHLQAFAWIFELSDMNSTGFHFFPRVFECTYRLKRRNVQRAQSQVKNLCIASVKIFY